MFVTGDINPFTFSLVDWGLLHPIKDSSEAYKTFLNVFTNLYEITFPIIKIKVNSKIRLSLWITHGILKPSKRKQKLHEKFFEE